jgi:hypothetical protein
MFAFEPPYLPLICLLVLGFLAVFGTLATVVQFFRCMNEKTGHEREAWWVGVWAALGLPSWIGVLAINFILDAIRRGMY